MQPFTSTHWIILFGTLALTLVLLNGIALTLDRQQPSGDLADQYCQANYERLPSTCPITAVYDCQSHVVLRSGNCPSVGDIILDTDGSFIEWCGYATLGPDAPPDCQPYYRTPSGADCLVTNVCT